MHTCKLNCYRHKPNGHVEGTGYIQVSSICASVCGWGRQAGVTYQACGGNKNGVCRPEEPRCVGVCVCDKWGAWEQAGRPVRWGSGRSGQKWQGHKWAGTARQVQVKHSHKGKRCCKNWGMCKRVYGPWGPVRGMSCLFACLPAAQPRSPILS